MKRKARPGLWPVRCAPVSSVAVGSVLWLHRGQLHCTAIIKATFTLPESGMMIRANPVPIRRTDDYMHGVPSLAGASEVAPRMDQVDVTVVGRAYADPPVTKRAVRFSMVSGQQFLIDKTLYVYGDRVKGGAPKPFSRMRIGYEHALGGLDFPKNPIGLGYDEDSSRLPNVVDPKRPTRRVAGYGPIPSRFQQRRQLRGNVKLEHLEHGIVEYPDDFSWQYFQAAPRSQRLERIKGNEWVLLEGLHPKHKRLRARLPKVMGLCRIYQRKQVGAPEMLELRADMLHIEPEDNRCSLVWRGSFPIASELAAGELIIAGGVQHGAEPVHWPASHADLDVVASPAPAEGSIRGERPDDLQATALSPGVSAQAAIRSLGGGYRLGDKKLELADAPFVEAEVEVEVEVEDAGEEPAWDATPAPPPPPSLLGAPPSLVGEGPGASVPGASVPGASPSGAWPAAPHTPVPPATAAPHTPMPAPAAPVEPEHPMAGTDPMANPEEADAKLSTTAERADDFSRTDEMTDPDADALEDAEHPLALTEVVIELGDDDLVDS